MTNKWTVNGVEAPEGAEFYSCDLFRRRRDGKHQYWYSQHNRWEFSHLNLEALELQPDYQPRPTQLSRIEIIGTNGNDGEHYSDYAFCLSEAINKLKHCADVAPDDKRKDALLEIVEEVEFIRDN